MGRRLDREDGEARRNLPPGDDRTEFVDRADHVLRFDQIQDVVPIREEERALPVGRIGEGHGQGLFPRNRHRRANPAVGRPLAGPTDLDPILALEGPAVIDEERAERRDLGQHDRRASDGLGGERRPGAGQDPLIKAGFAVHQERHPLLRGGRRPSGDHERQRRDDAPPFLSDRLAASQGRPLTGCAHGPPAPLGPCGRPRRPALSRFRTNALPFVGWVC